MASIKQPVPNIYYVPDANLAAYTTAGWVTAAGGDLAAWQAGASMAPRPLWAGKEHL